MVSSDSQTNKQQRECPKRDELPDGRHAKHINTEQESIRYWESFFNFTHLQIKHEERDFVDDKSGLRILLIIPLQRFKASIQYASIRKHAFVFESSAS